MRRFNGIGDKIVSPAKVAGLASWTLALWIDYDGTAANQWQHPIGLGTGHDATVYVIEATGQLAMKTTDSAGNAVVDAVLTTLTTNTWYHVPVTFDGRYVTGYVNGIMQGSSQAGVGTAIRSDSVKVGTSGAEASNFFGGCVEEVHVIPRALSSAEVATLYGGYSPLPVPTIVTKFPSGNTGTCTPPDYGDWTNPANVYAADYVYADAPYSGIVCNKWNAFGFNIPSGATIGTVVIRGYWSSFSEERGDAALSILLPGFCIADTTPQQGSFAFDQTSFRAWTPADFNSIAVEATAESYLSFTSLDYIKIEVTYTTGGGGSASGPGELTHFTRTYTDGLGRAVRHVTMEIYGRKIETRAALGWNDKPTTAYIPSGGYFSHTYDFLGRTMTVKTPPTSSVVIDQWLAPVAGPSTSDYNTWDGRTGCTLTTHYDCVNDDATPDDATSYVNTATASEKESHLMGDLSIPAGYTDIDVTWEGRCQRASSSPGG